MSMSNQSGELILAIFEQENRAADVLELLKTYDNIKQIKWRSAVVEMDKDGKISFQSAVVPAAGSVFGAVIGGILGLFVGAPLGGMVVGSTVAGLGVSRYFKRKKIAPDKVDFYTEDVELEEMIHLLTPNMSAVIAWSMVNNQEEEFTGSGAKTLVEAFEQAGAVKVIRRELDDEIAAALASETT
jgi:uncharacterized membrane protein